MDPIPLPPTELLSAEYPTFAPAPDLEEWVRLHFIVDKDDPFYNADHEHLEEATMGFLWASIGNKLRGEETFMTCGLGVPSGGTAWTKAQREQQIREWFGGVPDFLITIDAEMFAEAGDPVRLAALDHECYHAAQKRDKYGQFVFDKQTSCPVWEIRPHDVSEFVGVVRRWGAGPAAGRTREMVEAANRLPEIANARIEAVCGTCGRQMV